ncbi:hypothetical protein K2Q02_00390, partial [Patescibacteria group bacterium]|nr:hypothetical protein [Patescibacteria group bacterium]
VEILKKSNILSQELQLSRNPDDYWLALFMNKLGRLEVTNKTYVTQYTKETSTKSIFARNRENHRNGDRMKLYMKKIN